MVAGLYVGWLIVSIYGNLLIMVWMPAVQYNVSAMPGEHLRASLFLSTPTRVSSCQSAFLLHWRHIWCVYSIIWRTLFHFTHSVWKYTTAVYLVWYSSFSVAAPSAWNCHPSHIRTSSTYTLFLTRLKTHLFAESLLCHCYAVLFSLYFWRPRALAVGRQNQQVHADWLIDASDVWLDFFQFGSFAEIVWINL